RTTKPLRWPGTGAPGPPRDTLARIIAEPLATLGQKVVVENRPGGVGTIAMNAVARAIPDGHTLGVIGLPQAVAPSLLPEIIGYHTQRDLVPVTQLVWTANVLVVRRSSPLHT